MDNPFLKRQQQASKNAHGKRSETQVAKTLGARLRPASGALAHAKGDAVLRQGKQKFLVEAKSTIHNSLSLELDWLIKIQQEALENAAVPALTISFVFPDGKPKRNGQWVALPLAEYQTLLEQAGVHDG